MPGSPRTTSTPLRADASASASSASIVAHSLSLPASTRPMLRTVEATDAPTGTVGRARLAPTTTRRGEGRPPRSSRKLLGRGEQNRAGCVRAEDQSTTGERTQRPWQVRSIGQQNEPGGGHRRLGARERLSTWRLTAGDDVR